MLQPAIIPFALHLGSVLSAKSDYDPIEMSAAARLPRSCGPTLSLSRKVWVSMRPMLQELRTLPNKGLCRRRP